MNKEEILIKECEPLITSIAKKFYQLDYNDLYQAGVTGLINAIRHYNPDSQTKFSTFAYQYIFGEMYNLALTSKTIKQNRDILKLTKLITKATTYLTQKEGREPTSKEISSYLEIPEETITQAINLTTPILSLDKEMESDTNLYNTIKSCEPDSNTLIDLKDSLASLTPEEQEIIKYRYYNDLTQQETATILGLTQVSVSRYEKRSLTKMYNYLNS